MAIYEICKPEDEGAQFDEESKLYVRQVYAGMTLQIWERNGYDDSDFGVLVWDESTGAPKRIETWSTRGGSYGWMRYEMVDATPEVYAKYIAWQREQTRAAQRATRKGYAKQLRVLRKEAREAAAALGFPYWELLRVRDRGLQTRRLGKLVRLLKSKPRSPFKVGLKEQAVLGLRNPDRLYPCPLSPRQLNCLDDYGFKRGSMYSGWGAQSCPLLDHRLGRVR